MNKRMKKTVSLCLAALFILSCCVFSACSNMDSTPGPTEAPAAESPISGTPEPTADASEKHTPEPTGTPEPSAAPEEYIYRIDYSVIPNAIIPVLTEADIEAYFAVMEAFAKYETGVTVEADDGIGNIYELLDLCFPVFFADVYDSSLTITENSISWSYNVDAEEHYRLIGEFEDIVLEKLDIVLNGEAKDSNELLKALVLYRRMTTELIYDYPSQYHYLGEYTISESQYMNHCYDALTSERGVCWCYARAYAFLLNHIGIEALTVSCDGGIGHHEWTMFFHDGSWFFADPTWDLGGSLSYFGITTVNRESVGYLYEDMRYFAGADHRVSDAFVINDTRFSSLNIGGYGTIDNYDFDYDNNLIVMNCLSYSSSGYGNITVIYDLATYTIADES